MSEDLLPVDGVCGVYPAVDVHDAAAHAVRHAVYGVADKLAGGHLSNTVQVINIRNLNEKLIIIIYIVIIM